MVTVTSAKDVTFCVTYYLVTKYNTGDQLPFGVLASEG